MTTPGVIHYATYFDRHYLTRGLALYDSLRRHSPPFVLWVLCLDDETRRVLARLRLERVRPVTLAELERADPALAAVKPSRRPLEYYWTCTASFLAHLFERQPEVETLTYLDADLRFFGDPTPIYAELGARSIALVPHGQWRGPDSTRRVRWEAHGAYNNGLLVFRRTPAGRAALRWWRERCLEWCFYRIEPGRFGDQKYLDEVPGRFGEVAVLGHPGVNLGPWNLPNHRIRREGGHVVVDANPLVCYHFSRLRTVTSWLYDPQVRWRGYDLDPTVKQHVYVPYARALRAAGARVRVVGGQLGRSADVRFAGGRPADLLRMLHHRSFLVVTDHFAL